MVEQVTQFGISDGSVVLANGAEHGGVRVSLVGNQIAQHLEHVCATSIEGSEQLE